MLLGYNAAPGYGPLGLCPACAIAKGSGLGADGKDESILGILLVMVGVPVAIAAFAWVSSPDYQRKKRRRARAR